MNKPEPNDTLASHPDRDTMPPETLEEQLATTLYLAGEAIIPGLIPEPAHHAVSEDDRDAPLLDDFDWLNDLLARFRQALAQDPKRAELLRLLPQGFGDGEILRVLFCNLFPEQKGKRKVYRDVNGKPKLSPIQIEILRDVAVGMAYKEIAAKRRCSYANVSSAMQHIFRRLNASSLQEAVATAISTGCLPLDVMDFVLGAGNCAPKDFSPMDSMLSRLNGIEKAADPAYWQQLAAFGLMLLVASGAGVGQETYVAEALPTQGALYRLEPQRDGTYQARQVVGPGLIRYPMGLAVAPPAAIKEGFTPGNVFVVHNRAVFSGRNMQEILEFRPEGEFVRAFCGARADRAKLTGTHSLAFAPSGALQATSENALLRFTEGGRVVHRLLDGCCTDVCTDRQGNLYLAYYSTRGGSIRVYSRRGKLLREFAQQPSGVYLATLAMTGSGEIAALRREETERRIEFYDAQGEHQRCWRVPEDIFASFALDVAANLLFIPCDATKAVQVYTPEGTLRQRIALDARFTPRFLTLGNDGALWLSGVVTDEVS